MAGRADILNSDERETWADPYQLGLIESSIVK